MVVNRDTLLNEKQCISINYHISGYLKLNINKKQCISINYHISGYLKLNINKKQCISINYRFLFIFNLR
jgi:uncharacterized protein YxeA